MMRLYAFVMWRMRKAKMKSDRVIKLPVFRTMFLPVARKERKCCICKEPIEVGSRYVHYFDRRVHEIKDYRFHVPCFDIVTAYCKDTDRTSFSPATVRKWLMRRFCEPCGKGCKTINCKLIESFAKNFSKQQKKA